jgi:hypothetical protein
LQVTERNKIREYLEPMKVRQVVEHVWFDWCDFIGMQISAIKSMHKFIPNKFKSLILWVVVFQRNACILNKTK